MAFSGSFPAKTIELGAIALAYTVEVTDVVKATDYVEKSPSKSLKDMSKSVDWYSKTSVKVFVEVGIPCDYVSKTPSKVLVDYAVGIDRLGKDVLRSFFDWSVGEHSVIAIKGYRREFLDVVRTTDCYSKGVGKTLADVSVSRDYLRKDVLRNFVEVGIPCDWVAKTVSKSFLDWSVGEHSVIAIKGYSREFLDVVRTTDFYSKGVGKTLADVSVSCDYLRKDVLRSFFDWAVGEHWVGIGRLERVYDTIKVADYVGKDVGKALIDVAKSTDWLEKGLLKAVVDITIPCDYLAKAVGKQIEFEAPVTDWMERTVARIRTLADVVRVVDWRGGFDVVKCLKDYVVARDAPYRVVTVVLRDTWTAEYYVSRGVSPAVRDRARMADVLTKVAYKLAGYDVRRVYFHKVWGDIIEDTDQNVKIEVCKAMLEAFKRIKEKL